MKILVVHNSYQQRGGEDIVVEQECRLLRERGHEVLTYTRSNHEIGELSLIHKMGLLKRIISADDTKLEVADALRTFKPDLVHVHNTFMMISPSVYEACREADVPVIQTLHNYRLLCPSSTFYRDGQICEECVEYSLLRSIRHRCYRDSHVISAAVALMLKTHRGRRTWDEKVDSYIALTQFARQKFIDNGFPAERIFVKPNFVAIDPGARTYPGEYALFVGRLSREKGVMTLLDAWERLPRKVPLLIVGEGPLRFQLESEVGNRRILNVHFTGWLNRDEVNAVMKKAAFLVVPSTWYETFGMIVAEAFACGIPVLGSRLGAIEELIDDGLTGLHFAAGDANDLAEKAAWAWEHSEDLKSMGILARRSYETNYTAESNYLVLTQIYRRAIAQHALPSVHLDTN